MIILDPIYAEIEAYLRNPSSTIDEYQYFLATFCKGNWKRFKKLFAGLDLVKNHSKQDEYLTLFANHVIHPITVDCALHELYNLFGEDASYKKISDDYQESITGTQLMNMVPEGQIALFEGFSNDCPGLDEKTIFGKDEPRAEAGFSCNDVFVECLIMRHFFIYSNRFYKVCGLSLLDFLALYLHGDTFFQTLFSKNQSL